MRSRPEFEVLRAIVGSVPVAVVDLLVRFQLAPELLGHCESVPEYVPGVVRVRMVGPVEQHIASTVEPILAALWSRVTDLARTFPDAPMAVAKPSTVVLSVASLD
jgi:hypothetical protein